MIIDPLITCQLEEFQYLIYYQSFTCYILPTEKIVSNLLDIASLKINRKY